MRFFLLAADYDGTLAHDGKVDEETIQALQELRTSGRKSVLVTGRQLPELREIFPKLELFDRVVAENGSLLYRPETREEVTLCESPDQHFVSLLQAKGVPFSVGRCIVATWQPHDAEVLDAIREAGVDLHVTYNKGAVMALPSGITKASGLTAALGELGVSRHNVVGIGDAENDHSFLRVSECAVAVANAVPALKERADVVLDTARGAGVVDLIKRLIADDLVQFESKLQRHSITLGQRVDDSSQQVCVSARAGSILIAGTSGSGKSTTVTGILEQLIERGYQFCLLDPEGDYEDAIDVLSFGTAKQPPDVKAAVRRLENPEQSVLLNALGVPLGDRPGFFSSVLAPLHDLRLHFGHPHWLVVDEAHHVLPEGWSPATAIAPQMLQSAVLITVHPEHVAKSALEPISVVVAVGKTPMETLRTFCKLVQSPPPAGDDIELAQGEILVWFRHSDERPLHVKAVRSTREKRRHVRQYAEGELPPDQSFYFRGPDSKLNLRAQNLKIFVQLAEGVDDATWMHHLRQGDYSAWFKTMIKDEDLAKAAAEVEQDRTASPQESRERIKEAVLTRYTAPA